MVFEKRCREEDVMSRAFMKEPDDGGPPELLPERSISEHTNYVTPEGHAQLQEEAVALQARRMALLETADDPSRDDELRRVDRDLRYVTARLESAVVVDPSGQPPDEVAFGAAVTVAQKGAAERTFTIVGEDEADLASGKVSYVSPLADALLGAAVGDRVLWRRPAGDVELTVVAIEYGAAQKA
jgi:transcription elongation GreA/GreB family factor